MQLPKFAAVIMATADVRSALKFTKICKCLVILRGAYGSMNLAVSGNVFEHRTEHKVCDPLPDISKDFKT